ncbi:MULTISPECIES: hypothetical protein [unclassified Aquimarina]|uniref:hypothetical protein n=1 Tax=unclassified Aquimarina TaxID=2627091 RepID=UPI0018CBBF92|nr:MULTISPECIES: hypothetical protein [unclassified Aquimarina]MBG6130728.1 hypothetical protein [Aquimarina sp. EL_35]MBG6151126.1 hypothetical protein [Aquimarina sp. EL_32]
MNTQKLIERVDYLIGLGQRVRATEKYGEFVGSYVDSGLQMGFRTASLSFIKTLYGDNHPYYTDYDVRVQGDGLDQTDYGINILIVIKTEIENDWLYTIKGIISAEIFSDFMDMAEHLLENGYKDPAAVMIGSVLEEHIRQLCLKNGIDTTRERSGKNVPVSADSMNNELAKAGVYNKLDQKNITAQLDLRNKAAHGHYAEYDKSQVEVMYKSVLDFITRHQL